MHLHSALWQGQTKRMRLCAKVCASRCAMNLAAVLLQDTAFAYKTFIVGAHASAVVAGTTRTDISFVRAAPCRRYALAAVIVPTLLGKAEEDGVVCLP